MKQEDIELLKDIADFEAQHDMEKDFPHGWSWRHVRPIAPAVLSRLYREGYLDSPLHSNAATWYVLSEKGKQVVADQQVIDQLNAPAVAEGGNKGFSIPEDLFNSIEGFEDIKRITLKAIRNEKPVHLLYTGVPGSAKTMFLLELFRLGASYVLGSDTTKSGLADLIFDMEPKILLVDEIDHIGVRDTSILLSLMQTGIVAETKSGKTRRIELQTRVFAASNTTKINPALLSRFLTLYFRPYNRADFLKITENILEKKEGAGPEMARYIAQKVWELPARFADPRQAINIARLADTPEEVDIVIGVIKRRGDEYTSGSD